MALNLSLRAFRSKTSHGDLGEEDVFTRENNKKPGSGGSAKGARRRSFGGLLLRGLQPKTKGRKRGRKFDYQCIEIPPRSIWIGSRRTSIRLEPEFWDALDEIAGIERTDVSGVLLEIERLHGRSRFASKVRVAILGYFRPGEIAPAKRAKRA